MDRKSSQTGVATSDKPVGNADRKLVARIQQGDVAAFELLVIKYQSRVVRVLSRFIRDTHEVEDVAQEVFLKAYKAINNFRQDSSFYTWIYRIAINTAKNYLEISNRNSFIVQDSSSDEEDDSKSVENTLSDQCTPEQELMSKQVANMINKVIQSLPEELREALILREVDGLSYDDIAIVMDCPIGTVRSRIFRARTTIAEKLKPFLNTQKGKCW